MYKKLQKLKYYKKHGHLLLLTFYFISFFIYLTLSYTHKNTPFWKIWE